MTENDDLERIKSQRGVQQLDPQGRTPINQALINGGIAAGLCIGLGFVLMALFPRLNAEAIGRLSGRAAVEVGLVAFFFSLLWLKRKRFLACGGLAMIGILMVIGILSGGKSSSSEPSRFDLAAKKGTTVSVNEGKTLVRHQALGFEIIAPFDQLEALPVQQSDSLTYLWPFRDSETGSVMVLVASNRNLATRSELKKFTDGMVEGLREEAAANNVKLEIVSFEFSPENSSATLEGRFDVNAFGVRVVYVDDDKLGFPYVVGAHAIARDREAVLATVVSLSPDL